MSNQELNNFVDSLTESYTPPDDENIILDLLDEYSAKLREMIEIRRNHMQSFTFIIFTVGTLLLFSVTAFVVSLSNGNLIYWSYSISIFVVIIVFSLLYYNIRTQRYLKWTKENILVAKNELEKVIRVASQLEDHYKYEGYGLQLKAQLRLTESESTIRLADDILGTKYPHPYSKPDDHAEPSPSYSDLPASSNAS